MRIATHIVSVSLLIGGSVSLVACQSSGNAGVKTNYHSQWTDVAADTKTTAAAARSVLMADDLKDVKSDATEVDGTASGKKADGTKVAVAIKKTDAGSQVSVTVGTMGDPSLGASYASRIKAKAESK